jgi:ubiquitin carboxyl-terminal hydrolase 2/21
MGGLGGGHYIAHHLGVDDDKWYCKDDSRVSKVDASTLSNMSSAYVLFYKARKD